MSAQRKKGGSWLKYGCFGCLGLVVFLVLIAVGLAGIARMQVRSEEVTETTLRPELPQEGVGFMSLIRAFMGATSWVGWIWTCAAPGATMPRSMGELEFR